ncbi:MAG: class II glutamine amidotransferase, partial [Methanosphaera sp.]|nr:class II glutamine amidotransferase [Methanosphaera sp.]
KDVQVGNTDSERILHQIVDCVDNSQKDGILDDDRLCKLINDIICRLSKDNKLNLIVSNGQITFIHSNCRKSLYYLDKNDRIIVSTLALTDEDWIEVDLNTVYAIKDAKIIYKGPAHDNEYVITEDDVDFILNHLGDEAMNKLLASYGSIENIKRQLSKTYK